MLIAILGPEATLQTATGYMFSILSSKGVGPPAVAPAVTCYLVSKGMPPPRAVALANWFLHSLSIAVVLRAFFVFRGLVKIDPDLGHNFC